MTMARTLPVGISKIGTMHAATVRASASTRSACDRAPTSPTACFPLLRVYRPA